jgi:hypothetical protein
MLCNENSVKTGYFYPVMTQIHFHRLVNFNIIILGNLDFRVFFGYLSLHLKCLVPVILYKVVYMSE